MRKILMFSAAALLVSTGALRAQETTVNFGYRGASSDGDQARWERFRDLRSGPLVGARYIRDDKLSGVEFNASEVGYHDQKYTFDYNRYGKLKVSALWNSIPLNYAYNTLTPWVDRGNNVWTLDPATRTAVQNGALGIGTNATQYNQATVYRALAQPFSMQSRRDILSLGMKYHLTDRMGLDLDFSSAKRGGTQPYGGSFAFNDANERPMTLDNRTNDMTAAVEWAKPASGMLRVQWNGSRFKNQFQSLTWDNPLRATDYDNGKAPPAGPYDASGYSNGRGPAMGRLALPPSNSMNSFSLLGLRKLSNRTVLNGQVAYTSMTQNEQLIPWTTNTKIANAAVYALFPGLASLPRQTAEAEVHAVNAVLNFTTHPTEHFTFDAHFRHNTHENKTPAFDASNSVRFDAVPEAEAGLEPDHFNIRQNLAEAAGTFTMLRNTAFKIGYTYDDVQRDGRAFKGLTDHTFKVSADNYTNQYFMVRAVYEFTRRVGHNFDQEVIDEGGAQPGLRFYDEAPLDRNRGTLILQVNPSDKFDLGLTVASGKDKYNGEGHTFGLLDNSNTSYNVNLDLYVSAHVTLTGNYGYDKFTSLQKSRNGNPLGTTGYQSFNDPNRDWNLDNGEGVKTFGLYLDVTKPLPNTDVKFSYDRSKSDNAFTYSGPRIQELSTNVALTPGDGSPCGAGFTSCFGQLPNVTNDWQQLRVTLQHQLGARLGLNAGYAYEKFDVTDFATTDLTPGTPRMDPLGEISTGYGNRPYSGNTFFVSFSYRLQSPPSAAYRVK